MSFYVLESFVYLARSYKFSFEAICEKEWMSKSKYLDHQNWIRILSTLMNNPLCHPEKKISFLYHCTDKKDRQKR